ncbi:hypothetical protein [Cellulomonas sp. S1-8]|uniref:hypothetical protein n=1 Tax=Cellulomonas sp. S1-8 TaxID=2904790 RepID=UPI002244C169|nr:hypothetical protein [Cellulomonas sp. S1-8]UZN03432.1 hypothetical protein OKX07_00355 [Cellulomonas sp. S1-8]
MARARRVEVLLDDAPDEAAPSSPSDPPPTDRPTAPPAGRRRWWWAAVPVTVVLALVVGQVVTDRRESAELAALAAVPGVAATLDRTVAVAWDVDPGTRLDGAARVGSMLVAAHVTADHAVTLEGRDVATGARAWVLDLVDARPAWSPDAQADPAPCVALPARPGQVTCLVGDGGTDLDSGRWTPYPATTTRLLVLDPADGTVVVDREVPVSAQWLTPLGDDVLLVGNVGGVVHVRSQDLVDGTERWHVTADVAADDGPFSLATAVSALVDEQTLAVDHGSAVTLVSTDGDVLRTVGAPTAAVEAGLTQSTRVATSRPLAAAVVGDETGTTIASAAREVRVDGSPLPVTVDDGSVPGLVLTRMPRLQAWDADDGEARWATTIVDAQDATILDGRVHVGTSAAVVTFDGATGAELWRVRRPTATGNPATDGRHLYVTASQGGRHSAPYDLVALHPADGTEAWRVPMPVDSALAVVEGLLLGAESDGEGGGAYRVLR